MEQELLDKTSALENQLETETSSLLQRKRAAKEALLDAKEKTTKIEVFTKESDNLVTIMKAVESASIQASAKHAEEMTALKSDMMEEMKDELQCAEDEVIRCREITVL